MKTKTLFCLCLFLGIGLIQLSAQNGNNNTGAVVTERIWDGYWQPVFCNGNLIDYITGTVSQHVVVFFKDGIMIKASFHTSGEVRSANPPYEVFRVSENGKDDHMEQTSTWHFNLVGEYGTHYIGTMIWNWITNESTAERIVCPGNDN